MWKLDRFSFNHRVLRERCIEKGEGHFVHNNPDVWRVLDQLDPDVVITTGFNPTHLYAFIWALLKGRKHICMTDGTLQSESALGWRHRWVRRVVYKFSDAFIAASRGGMDLYQSYKIKPERIFQSHLCADNARFSLLADNYERPYEVMFSGRFEATKLPFLFVEVCAAIKLHRGRCRALLIGDGTLRDEVLARLAAAKVDYHYAGFLQQDALPASYSSAKILLFTTRWDPWGVVANEALAAGTPVITTTQAGVAGELVMDGLTGAVCEPNVDAWVAAALRLLDQPQHWLECSLAGRQRVAQYNYQAAADGIAAACLFALKNKAG